MTASIEFFIRFGFVCIVAQCSLENKTNISDLFQFATMSILYSHEDSYFISHDAFINRVYSKTQLNGQNFQNFDILPAIFDLNVPYRSQKAGTVDRQRKIANKKNCMEIDENRQEFELVII